MSLSQIQPKAFRNDDEDLSYEKMEEDLTCPVCLELYADPLMMPCSHSVCKACIHDIRASRYKLGQSDFECPTCRDKHPMSSEQLDKLPKNLALENIVFRYQEIKSLSLVKKGQANTSFNLPAVSVDLENTEETDSVFEETNGDCHCGMCDEGSIRRADWFCPQCQVFYCQQCLATYHPRRGSLGRHRICRPTNGVTSKNSLPCPEHTDETVSIFCDTCQTVACHLCVCQGQGSHGSHVILDLTTARKQIQTTVTKAKEELKSLMSLLTLRNRELESQLEIVKSVRDLTEFQVKSQYQCILADVAASLSLAKHKFTDTLTSDLSEHMKQLHSKSQEAKASLERCQKLRESCQMLAISGKNKSSWNLSFSRNDEEKLSDADQSATSDLSGSSLDGGSNDSSLVEDGKQTSPSAHGGRDKVDVKRGKLNDEKNVYKNVKLNSEERSATKTMEDQRMMTSTPVSCPSPSETDASRRQTCVSTNNDDEKDQGDKQNKAPVEERKQSMDRQNSERKFSEKQYDKVRWKTDIGGRRSETLSVSSICDNEKRKDQNDNRLLTQAKEIGSLLNEIIALNSDFQQLSTYEEEALNEITKKAWGSVSDFGRASLSLLSDLSDVGKEELDVPSIIPSVRSSVSPVSPHQKGMPRVQSRVLLTWGFNSTTFTAEPVAKNAQWTVTIARNTSHIGDVHSGYLFGVGVAKRSLTSKEQVGMNADSYGIVCHKGSLAFCHNGQFSSIMPLPDLPLSIRLSVFNGTKGTSFCYSLLMNTAAGTVQGRRVVSLFDENNGDDCLSSEAPLHDGCEMYPVFTVTQRVKMQFPLTSDV